MKRVVLLIVAVIFSASISAQTMPSVSTDDVKNAGVAVAAEQSPEVEKQIKDALMKDEGLQKETINYLKENPETTNALSKILVDNKDSLDGIIKSVLGDSALTTAAVDWIANNPEMLNKVMKIVGM
jgi:transcription termination factor NusB